MSVPLFTPFSLRDLTLANRIVVAPMCQYAADDGSAYDSTAHVDRLITVNSAIVYNAADVLAIPSLQENLALTALEAQACGTPLIATRRGAIAIMARADRAVAEDMVFVPFAYVEAAANILTNPALDPYGKIPEFKFCAVRVTPEPA